MKTYNNKSIMDDINAFENDLSSALHLAMGGIEVEMKYIAQEYLEEEVYSYEPKYRHRRHDGMDYDTGELLDFESSLYSSLETSSEVNEDVYGATLSATATLDYTAPWQNEGASSNFGMSLADAVETGIGMHNAGARPFVEKTDFAVEQRVNDYILTEALNRSGYVDAID